MKSAQQAEQQERRRRILEERESKKQQLQEKLDTINFRRSLLRARAAAVRSGMMFCSALTAVVGKQGPKRTGLHAHTAVTHVIMTDLLQRRKEEENARLRLQQAVSQDETVLALRRKLEELELEHQLEHQRLKRTESKKVKTSKKNPQRHTTE